MSNEDVCIFFGKMMQEFLNIQSYFYGDFAHSLLNFLRARIENYNMDKKFM